MPKKWQASPGLDPPIAGEKSWESVFAGSVSRQFLTPGKNRLPLPLLNSCRLTPGLPHMRLCAFRPDVHGHRDAVGRAVEIVGLEVSDQGQLAELARPRAVGQLAGAVGCRPAAVGLSLGVEHDLLDPRLEAVIEAGDPAVPVLPIQPVEVLDPVARPDPAIGDADAPGDAVVGRRGRAEYF